MTPAPDEKFYAEIARRLSLWYEAAKRDLPWRRTRDPYAVLVSELMLQQTQVSRAAVYFPRWMERFPTLESLARAGEDEVIALWQGLGYYSRARNLHKCAQLLVSGGHTTLPADPAALGKLPGLGAYTTGAVCSIAFDLPVPAVDGNVRRVLSRVLNMETDPARQPGVSLVTETVGNILRRGCPRTLTQAFMELGATVCTPGAACRCAACPLADLCAAHSAGVQAQRPVTSTRPSVLRRAGAALLAGSAETGWLVRRRPKGGLWADFYEIPWEIGNESESPASCLRRLREKLGISAPCADCELEETLKFTCWHVRVRLFALPLPDTLPPGTRRADRDELLALPMPAGLKRLARAALDSPGKQQLDLFARRS